MVRKEKNLGETKEETLSLVEVGWLKREQGGERKRLEWSCPLQLVFSRFFLLLLSTFIFHHLNFVELWNSFTWFSLSWHLLIFDVEKSSIIYRWPCPLDRLSVTSPPTRVHIENSTSARKLEMLQHYLSWQVKHCLDWVGAAIILSWDDWLTQRLGENCWKGKDSSVRWVRNPHPPYLLYVISSHPPHPPYLISPHPRSLTHRLLFLQWLLHLSFSFPIYITLWTRWTGILLFEQVCHLHKKSTSSLIKGEGPTGWS